MEQSFARFCEEFVVDGRKCPRDKVSVEELVNMAHLYLFVHISLLIRCLVMFIMPLKCSSSRFPWPHHILVLYA